MLILVIILLLILGADGGTRAIPAGVPAAGLV